jgi:hypothetical protein
MILPSVRSAAIVVTSSLAFVAIDAFAQDAGKDVQGQLDALKAALPKFAGNFQPTRGRRLLFYEMSGTRPSGRALSGRRGTGDETWLARAAADGCGARSIAQRERLHDDSQRAHRAIASGPNAQAFDNAHAFDNAQAFDKALSQRHGSGSRPPRRLDPPVRG